MPSQCSKRIIRDRKWQRRPREPCRHIKRYRHHIRIMASSLWRRSRAIPMFRFLPAVNHREQPVNDSSIRSARLTSVFLRRLGKSIATLNSIWIFISCMSQLSNFYDRCYCNSDVFWLWGRAYNVIQLVVDDLAGMKGAWLGGVFLGCGDLCWVRRIVQWPCVRLAFPSIAFLLFWDDVADSLPSFEFYTHYSIFYTYPQ